ncbi:G-protein alpha subunit-domain-containing protein [Xylariales sp. PMI_506]|nr:G-protein alpha subunit-domain-containing protein [Xylariales sp. PMI_506]
MTDPITIISAAVTVASIIEILGKSISRIAEFRSQWQDADLTMLSLESQLAALNAALNKIYDWADSNCDNPHHQLVMDLDRSVACCRLLVNNIDGHISQIQVTPGDRLDVAGKLRLLLKSKDFENTQRMIEQQTGALTLLLTACNTTVLSEQQELLVRPENRRIFRKIENDTESLLVHRDIDSMMTSYTATSISSSKRSVHFSFDAELFVSRIYQRWIRGPVRKSLHEQQLDTPYIPRSSRSSWENESEQRKRSQMIDRIIAEDSKRLGRECKALLVGSESKDEIVKRMRIYTGGHSPEQLQYYRPIIFANVCKCAKAIANALKQFGVIPETDPVSMSTDYIADYKLEANPASSPLNDKFRNAVESMLESSYYAKLMERTFDFYVPGSTEYFLTAVGRIAAPDYQPSDMDIMQAREKNTGIIETRFQMGALGIHMLNVGHMRTERKKWIHCFENITSIIYVVDLDTYDQSPFEEPSQTSLMESLLLFDSMVNSRWFCYTSIILLFNNIVRFKEKLPTSPLHSFFPDYEGGNDESKAVKYILWRFSQTNRAHLNLYPHILDSNDAANCRLIFAAIKETILNNAFRGLKRAKIDQ